jgi:hypothetical protein
MLCCALQALLEAFDASNVTSGMLWSLIQGWCGDVAAALAVHGTDVEPSVQLAANAAAGKWSSVVSFVAGRAHNLEVSNPSHFTHTTHGVTLGCGLLLALVRGTLA